MGEASLSVAVAFIVLGLLTFALPEMAAVNWIVAGVLALLVGWFTGRSGKTV